MKYEVMIQAMSEGHIIVEADSQEEAKTAAMKALFTGAIRWDTTKMTFPSITEQKA